MNNDSLIDALIYTIVESMDNGDKYDQTKRRVQDVLAVYSLNEMAGTWVSVEDGLPEGGTYVLLIGVGNRYFTALVEKGKFFAYNPFNDELEPCEEVTHWMPLPIPPGESSPTKVAAMSTEAESAARISMNSIFPKEVDSTYLQQKFAEHLGEKELNTTDKYAVKWTVKELSGTTPAGANTIVNWNDVE